MIRRSFLATILALPILKYLPIKEELIFDPGTINTTHGFAVGQWVKWDKDHWRQIGRHEVQDVDGIITSVDGDYIMIADHKAKPSPYVFKKFG
jgi:hypothetical protein